MTEERSNPAVQQIEIGVRTLRNVNLYPLSLADQFKMTAIIQKGLTSITQATDAEEGAEKKKDLAGMVASSDVEIIKSFVTSLQENIEVVIDLVFDPDDNVKSSEITNMQLTVIADHIFETNYRGAVGNLLSLFEKVSSLLPSKGLSQPSVENMEDID